MAEYRGAFEACYAGAVDGAALFGGATPSTGDGATIAIAVTRPSDAGWATGDRRYQCLLGLPGRQLVGDLLAGTGSPVRDEPRTT